MVGSMDSIGGWVWSAAGAAISPIARPWPTDASAGIETVETSIGVNAVTSATPSRDLRSSGASMEYMKETLRIIPASQFCLTFHSSEPSALVFGLQRVRA